MSAAVWLITGAQAAGKSTVAEGLAGRLPRAVHVRGGQFYRWVVRGWEHFDGADQHEARRHLELRYRLSSLVADEYAAAGFAAIVQDNIYGNDVVAWIQRIRARPVHLVVLRPTVDAVRGRDQERLERIGKVAYRGDFTPEINDEHVASTPRQLGLWLDTSGQRPAETVDEILARAAEAVVAPDAIG